MTQNTKEIAATLREALEVYDKVLDELAERHDLSPNYVAENYQVAISALLAVVRDLPREKK